MLAAKINEITLTIHTQAGTDGRLYGSITTKDIAEKLKAEFKIDIDKRKLSLQDPIKSYGTYNVDVKVYTDVSAKLKVSVKE